jgi:isoquinoline 1-oxidoreductase subunit beta
LTGRPSSRTFTRFFLHNVSMTVTRRRLLEAVVYVPGALVLGGMVPVAEAGEKPVRLTAWVRIAPDNSVTLIASQSEMGQGTSTTLGSVLADELGLSLDAVRVEFAPFDPAYRDPVFNWMFTGNSQGISSFYEVMRKAGAAAREMLVSAAAMRWTVSPDTVECSKGRLTHAATGRSLRLGEVVSDAARLPVPEKPKLRPLAPDAKRRSVPRWDIPSKTNGTAMFGIDMKVPGMVLATLQRAPRFGSRLEFADKAAIRAQPGVIATVDLPDGLAVVADTYWQAHRALSVGKLRWTNEGSDLSRAKQSSLYSERLKNGPFFVHKNTEAPSQATRNGLDAVYELPFQAHATMEPMNCVASVKANTCEIWAPTQGVEMCQQVVSQVTGLPLDRITIHRTFLGGGFGRRLLADFVKQAVIISRAVGKPVKLIWSREEDMTHDFYRPAVLHEIRGQLDTSGSVASLTHRVVSPSHMLYIMPRGLFPGVKDWTAPLAPPEKMDGMAVEGLLEIPYAIPTQRVEQHRLELDVPVSVWRTTGHGANNFVLESFIDELAAVASMDPLVFRQRMSGHDTRAARVLQGVAEKSRWGSPLLPGRARGIALAAAFGSVMANVVELSVEGEEIRLHRIVSVVDCGRVLDVGIATSNILGGIVWGLSAMQTAVTFNNGAVEQTNFDRFFPLQLAQVPPCEVYFVESGASLGGTGELGAVPVPAAVCNAVFAATRRRIRSLPISKYKLAFA